MESPSPSASPSSSPLTAPSSSPSPPPFSSFHPIVHLPSSHRLLFIGDVHGCYDELISLVTPFSIPLTQHDMSIVLVGDLVAKGPKSLECVDIIRQSFSSLFGSPVSTYCVMGNHEVLLLKCRDHLETLPSQFQFYSRDSSISLLAIRENSEHYSMAKEMTKEHIEFIGNLPLSITFKWDPIDDKSKNNDKSVNDDSKSSLISVDSLIPRDVTVVHAGIVPWGGKKNKEQKEGKNINNEDNEKNNNDSNRDNNNNENETNDLLSLSSQSLHSLCFMRNIQSTDAANNNINPHKISPIPTIPHTHTPPYTSTPLATLGISWASLWSNIVESQIHSETNSSFSFSFPLKLENSHSSPPIPISYYNSSDPPLPPFIVFGHDAARGLQQYSHCIGLDTGCCYGKELTGFVWPQMTLSTVKAEKMYSKPKGND